MDYTLVLASARQLGSFTNAKTWMTWKTSPYSHLEIFYPLVLNQIFFETTIGQGLPGLEGPFYGKAKRVVKRTELEVEQNHREAIRQLTDALAHMRLSRADGALKKPPRSDRPAPKRWPPNPVRTSMSLIKRQGWRRFQTFPL